MTPIKVLILFTKICRKYLILMKDVLKKQALYINIQGYS